MEKCLRSVHFYMRINFLKVNCVYALCGFRDSGTGTVHCRSWVSQGGERESKTIQHGSGFERLVLLNVCFAIIFLVLTAIKN